jgi:hypothetical protein
MLDRSTDSDHEVWRHPLDRPTHEGGGRRGSQHIGEGLPEEFEQLRRGRRVLIAMAHETILTTFSWTFGCPA